jgi:predicted CoA-substrate-specific enzyme activase
MGQEYWKWPESNWTSETIDWKKAERVTAGVDLGTTSAQAAIMCDGELFGYANVRLGADYKKAADSVIRLAMGGSGMALEDIAGIACTGWGHRNVAYAQKFVDEVHSHAKGARFMYGPDVHTVVNLGGQTISAIRLYDWDRVRDFMMNDKCATGFGRNVEIMCDYLKVPITEIGKLSLDVAMDPEPVSTTCFAFAGTETLGLFRQDFRAEALAENQVYASHLFALAWRALGVIGKLQPLDVGDITVYKELGFTGGLAKNQGVTERIERELKVTALQSEYDPMLAGAIGAAQLA